MTDEEKIIIKTVLRQTNAKYIGIVNCYMISCKSPHHIAIVDGDIIFWEPIKLAGDQRVSALFPLSDPEAIDKAVIHLKNILAHNQ